MLQYSQSLAKWNFISLTLFPSDRAQGWSFLSMVDPKPRRSRSPFVDNIIMVNVLISEHWIIS